MQLSRWLDEFDFGIRERVEVTDSAGGFVVTRVDKTVSVAKGAGNRCELVTTSLHSRPCSIMADHAGELSELSLGAPKTVKHQCVSILVADHLFPPTTVTGPILPPGVSTEHSPRKRRELST